MSTSVPEERAMAVSTYAWRRLDLEGISFVRLDQGDDLVRVDGHEICVDGGERWSTRFSMRLNGRWRLQSLAMEVTTAAGVRDLRLDGPPDGDVVDIAGNPFTNALVLRSRDAPVGGAVEVRAAFIETPALSVRPLTQRYRRLADDRWEYADDEFGAFQITVDADGVTMDYERLATRLG